MVKNLPANVGDVGLIPGLGISPGEEKSNKFQHSCLGNPMDRAAWWATVHGVTKKVIYDLTSKQQHTSSSSLYDNLHQAGGKKINAGNISVHSSVVF